MAIRTTATSVKKCIEVDDDIWDDEFISDASVLVDRVEILAGTGLSVAELTLMEKYLAAHFYAIRDPQYETKKTGRASAKFMRGKSGMGLESTQWGQQALAIDVTGDLASVTGSNTDGGVKTITADWGGTDDDA